MLAQGRVGPVGQEAQLPSPRHLGDMAYRGPREDCTRQNTGTLYLEMSKVLPCTLALAAVLNDVGNDDENDDCASSGPSLAIPMITRRGLHNTSVWPKISDEAVGARPFPRAVEDFGDDTVLLVGTNVHVVAQA